MQNRVYDVSERTVQTRNGGGGGVGASTTRSVGRDRKLRIKLIEKKIFNDYCYGNGGGVIQTEVIVI